VAVANPAALGDSTDNTRSDAKFLKSNLYLVKSVVRAIRPRSRERKRASHVGSVAACIPWPAGSRERLERRSPLVAFLLGVAVAQRR
jgi:hypothetical protein